MNIIEIVKHQQIFAVAGGIQSAFIAFIILSVIALAILAIVYCSENSDIDDEGNIYYKSSVNKQYLMKLKKMLIILFVIFIISIIGERTSASFKNASKVIILEYNSSFFEKIDKIERTTTND